jgi:hypothetical protein
MSCQTPVSSEELARYWSSDLLPGDVDRIDEHLMGCDACSAASGRMAAVAQAVRAFIPPIVTRAMLVKLAREGMRIEENTFAPGVRQPVVFRAGTDLLIHRLSGLDLRNAKRVRVAVGVESTGDVLMEVPDAPFDVAEGVLVACQRHFALMPPDVTIEVRAVEASGAELKGIYRIPHVFE